MEFYDRLKLTLIAFVLSFSCNFQYGFSSTYMNAPVDEFRNFINESLRHRGYVMDENTYGWMWNLIANVWFVGFFFGIWLSPVINDKFGRKIGFISMNAVSALASVLRFVAVVWMWPEALFVGRLLASVATAVTYQSLILFLQECSPTDLRGFFSFTSEISYSLCSLLGVFLGMESILGHNLKLLIGSAIIPSLVALVVLFPMHETPKFLYIVKGDGKKALQSIRFYHGSNTDVDAVVREIERVFLRVFMTVT
ncbi:Protein F14E5.1 [Aphelenchoides avenae]|nr:Protein F14E5.1 [Aphelenchus avenae]